MSESDPAAKLTLPATEGQSWTRVAVRLVGWYVILTACIGLMNCVGKYYQERRVCVDGNAIVAVFMMQWAYDLVRLRARGRKPIVVLTILQLILMLAGLGYLIATYPTAPLGSGKIPEIRLFTWTHAVANPSMGWILVGVLLVPNVLLVGFLMSRRVRELLAPSCT